MLQPYPRYRSPGDLNKRDREHYEVAKSLVGPFNRARFVKQYREKYPSRIASSIIPSDYCFNRDNKGNAGYPRFLLWDGRHGYIFVGLEGMEWTHANVAVCRAATPKPKSRRRVKAKPADRKKGRFLARSGASLILDPQVARAAITDFNKDLSVQSQEESAIFTLGDGFQFGNVWDQLRVLDRAYRTRAHREDINLIAKGIENSWERWSDLLSDLPDLAEELVPIEKTRELLAFFLAQETNRKPRSLATKALHFAAPRSYIPVDTYAADMLGAALEAGSWMHTNGLDTNAMASWYTDYLRVIHQIGARNQNLITELLQIDAETSHDPKYARTRGLPKLIDKILWWCGKEAREGREIMVFWKADQRGQVS